MKIELQGTLLKVTGRVASKSGKHERGKIKNFSDRSRKRLIDMINRIIKIDKAIFITLTFGQQYPDPMTAKRYLKNFIQRMRENNPGMSGVWRMEFQTRGAVHFHLLIFNLPFWKHSDLNAAWGDVIDPAFWDMSKSITRPPFTDIRLIKGSRMAMYYMSKYVAKTSQAGDSVSLINVPYPQIGRFWAWINVDLLPFDTLREVHFYATRALHMLRFFAQREFRGLQRYTDLSGFTIYIKNPQEWRIIIMSVLMETGICQIGA